MRVTLDDSSLSTSIADMLKHMENVCEKDKKSFLKRCGEILKKSVLKAMQKYSMRSKINRSAYVHMMDDIEAKVKKSKSGVEFLSVGGGKKTGHKWRWLNDGAIDQKGNVHNEANHFMEDAMKDANNDLESEIDNLLKKVVDSE